MVAGNIGYQSCGSLGTRRRVMDLARKRFRGALQGRGHLLNGTILQAHVEALNGAPGSDIPAHDPGTHHVHIAQGRDRRGCIAVFGAQFPLKQWP